MSTLPEDTEPILKQEIERLGREGQTVGHRQFSVKPNLRDIPEGGFVIGTDAGIKFIYTKINGARFKAALVADP